MFTFTLARIIGNELPPRDKIGNRKKSLEFILNNEFYGPECSKLWILNQIHDKKLLKEIKKILVKENFIELNFDAEKYRSSTSRDQKIIHAININKARNLAIEKSTGDFVFVFDGDCFFNKECWHNTISEIIDDQKKTNRKYYGVPGVRVVGEISENWKLRKMEEPSLVLRKDATMRFDESIPFSKAEKIDFLMRLGYPRGSIYPKGDACKNVGTLLHISFNEEISETSLSARMKLRDESIDNLLQMLDNKKIKKASFL